MQKLNFCVITGLILTIGLQIHFLKILHLPPLLATFSMLPLVVASIDKSFRLTWQALILGSILTFALVKILFGAPSSHTDLIQALVLQLVFYPFFRKLKKENSEFFVVIIYSAVALAIIGFCQSFGFTSFQNIAPLASSSFSGSGGFGDIALRRPNFALGNSLNVGLFFILCLFLLILIWDQITSKIKYLIFMAFLASIALSVSRTALLQLFVLLPLIYIKVGSGVFLFAIPLLFFLIYFSFDIIIIAFMRLITPELSAASNSERWEMIMNFVQNADLTVLLLGNIKDSGFKYTDGLVFYAINSIGALLSFVLLFELLGLRQNIKSINRSYIFFMLIFGISVVFSNSLFAFYNLFILNAILRYYSLNQKSFGK